MLKATPRVVCRRKLVLNAAVSCATGAFLLAAPTALPAAPAAAGRGVPALSLDQTPLSDTIAFLQNLTGLTISVDRPRLEQAGVERDAPVSLQLRNVSFRKTLTLILDGVSVGEPLTFYVDEGVVTITTLEHADSELIVKVYDVRDLLVDVPDFEAPDFGGGGKRRRWRGRRLRRRK